MRLEKYQALGNDFLVLLDVHDRRPVDGAVARAACDRHHGIGADGFIRAFDGLHDADVVMELWNADGGRAETSGNGLRCLARAVADAGMFTGSELRVATDAGRRRVWLRDDGSITVDMTPGAYGVVRTEHGVHVDLGNPHLVVEVDDPAKVDLAEETRPLPDVNVEFFTSGPGSDELTMRVWERGVGETLSCGSGACAAVLGAQLTGTVGDRVTVHQPGGDLLVEASEGSILLTGPAQHVGTAEWPGEAPCR
jgi:diaminopimelate epimerase